ncbi:hypothetical protein CC80DRAFT_499826 [Byssothecium circinans]|uniref:Uncharacterized protein n=1 Tax=Byssothecium circinans TaxID=147558 RepID=A0A6A5UFD7_9PLEO|nr:hypothetical protein CC80DRAFT_499826 [Byssothecium circinans]
MAAIPDPMAAIADVEDGDEGEEVDEENWAKIYPGRSAKTSRSYNTFWVMSPLESVTKSILTVLHQYKNKYQDDVSKAKPVDTFLKQTDDSGFDDEDSSEPDDTVSTNIMLAYEPGSIDALQKMVEDLEKCSTAVTKSLNAVEKGFHTLNEFSKILEAGSVAKISTMLGIARKTLDELYEMDEKYGPDNAFKDSEGSPTLNAALSVNASVEVGEKAGNEETEEETYEYDEEAETLKILVLEIERHKKAIRLQEFLISGLHDMVAAIYPTAYKSDLNEGKKIHGQRDNAVTGN